ncbi:hypothetical protein [Devosia nitrariae]|uniref:Uncharacterized protein n=1 Tax=Devosia nitrariae TaxID=2071872 RepID=A0ABQ5W132_9HYPH|nr:hypothetical protein [Devosia nitrariae]GLQ53602.1 hypothetical protein GCM10010862_08610 [Devosia nitrariae]
MGRQFEALISEASGFLSRRNAIALIAMAAGSVVTLQAAKAQQLAEIVGEQFNTAGTAGYLNIHVDADTFAVEILAADTPEAIAIKIDNAATGVGLNISAGVNPAGGITIFADGPDVRAITLSPNGVTLAALGLDGEIQFAHDATPEGFRPFSVGDGADPDLKVAVLMADAAALEEAVFVDKLAEVKSAKIVVPQAARAEAIAALVKQEIEVR